MLNLEYEQRLRQKMRAINFLSLMKFNQLQDASFDSRAFQNYKQQVKKVSRKIDKWHSRMSLKKEHSFNNDNDFVFMNESPSNFSDNSSDESDDVERD